jgi:hypothetical protein
VDGGSAGWPEIRPACANAGRPGGSGGGATAPYLGGPGGLVACGGSGNTPPVSPLSRKYPGGGNAWGTPRLQEVLEVVELRACADRWPWSRWRPWRKW